MNRADLIPQKILTAEQAVQKTAQWRILGKKNSFTNGVYDILNQVHIFYLAQENKEGDSLVVGLNSDDS